MGYNKENFRLVREEYEKKSADAQRESDARCSKIYAEIPGVRLIDRELSATGLKLMGAALGEVKCTLEEVRLRVAELRRQRGELLMSAGYPADYTAPRYDCVKCSDTGYCNGRMCECMKQRLVMAGYESSGIARLMKTQTFESFSFDYFADDRRALENMKYVFGTMKSYAEAFDPRSSQNVAFFGGTGLGKTHLSTATAKVIIERGYDVVYTGAIGMFADFEKTRFGNSAGLAGGEDINRYFNCDLLIIDDLGSEVTNQFTVSCIYDVINTRINRGLPIILSTNLRPEEMRTRYWDRITSRIFGEFTLLIFTGTDVRAKKLK